MSTIRIMLAGRDYEVTCDDGQEGHLKNLARQLDGRMRTLTEAMGRTGEAQLLMFAALMLTDELQEKTVALEQVQSDLHHSSQSFEKNKQIEIENVIASTIHNIADRIESIAESLERH